jgi:hypothetical protein
MTQRTVRVVLGLSIVASWSLLSGGGFRPLSRHLEIKNDAPQEVSFIKSLVDQISARELRNYVLALQGMGTRYASSRGNLRAAGYIRDAFLSFHLKDVALDEFSFYNDQAGTYDRSRNVVASKRGLKMPQRIVMIGAHFDTITRSAEDGSVSADNPENPAPGADDNGTGVATVLAAARLLSPLPFDCTLRFIAFSAEEAGIFGSAHYAAECARKGEDIIAVINVDQIGHVKEEPEDLDIFSNRDSAWLLDRIINGAPVYAPDLLICRTVNDSYDGSDHAPFWSNGYPAVCFMEDYYPSYRLYHTPKDIVDGIDFPFFLQGARLAVASLAELAGLRMDEARTGLHDSSRNETGFEGANWQRDSGKKFLFTLSPAPNQADIIDISLPRISSRASLSLGDLPPETWGQPRTYPVSACPNPADKLIYVSLIRLRAPGKEAERGRVEIIDPRRAQIVGSFEVNRYPTGGCFNAAGTRFYQPYQGEEFIDIFDLSSRKMTARIKTPLPLSQLAVFDGEKHAIGISTETGSVVLIDLARRSVEKVMRSISAPKDVVVLNDRLALVCSCDQAKIYTLDAVRKSISGEVATNPRPTRLIVSPQRKWIICLHQSSGEIDVFNLTRSAADLRLEKYKTLDLGEGVVDGTFGAPDVCYFVSPGKTRLFGYDLLSGKTLWAMRTGGVRGRGDVERIIYVGE